MQLGKVVKSNSHTDYVCQIYGEWEVNQPPKPNDYAFGNFVKIALATSEPSWIIGIIYDTVLVNPDFGRLGPRLSPKTDLAVFSPDYLNEKAVLIGIVTVGLTTMNGNVIHGVPSLAADSNSKVELLPNPEFRAFHDENSQLRLNYIPLLLHQGNSLAPYLVCVVLEQLRKEFGMTEQLCILNLLIDELKWQSQVGPFGVIR